MLVRIRIEQSIIAPNVPIEDFIDDVIVARVAPQLRD
jgi:hypothetical protein